MRKSGYFPGDSKFTIDIFDLLPPSRRQLGADQKIAFGEINIPDSLKKSPMPLAASSDPLRPDQCTANAIPQELATAANSNPAFAPYIEIDYSKKHWAPSIVEHESALNTFGNKMKQFKSAQPLSIQHYVLSIKIYDVR